MMIQSVKRECVRSAVRDSAVMENFIEDDIYETVREQELNKVLEIRSQQDKRAAKQTRRLARDRISHRWSPRLNPDEPFRAPFHFTWRC